MTAGAMRTIKVMTIVGARPQFIKAAAVSRAIAESNRRGEITIEERIVHTGQHYDDNMSKVFFDELEIPRPETNLGVGSGSHGQQTAAMLERLESVFVEARPDWTLLYGDTNSTLAGALAAAKLNIPAIHVEAGLRSFNRRMPEEVNRVVTDHLSKMLICPTDVAVRNLAAEGITEGVHQVGDVMYDSMLFNAARAERRSTIMSDLSLSPKSFYLATVHRPQNTDNPDRLGGILAALGHLDWPIVLPLHPRTRDTLGRTLGSIGDRVRVIDPIPYLDMLMLERNARIILTDSGGVQKEAYWSGVPCITLRDETEWVELIKIGCNRLAGADQEKILAAVADIEAAGAAPPVGNRCDLYGDGHSSERIVAALVRGSVEA